MELSRSKQLFEKAKTLIPGQTQTISKGHTQFVQGVSPNFIQKGKGCHVWDVDGNEFIDYPLALGPIILGYNYPKINSAIKSQLKDGITFSMPHPLEVELAEELCKIIPCAEMVRFGKNGTDVTSAAIRISRVYTGKDKIAYCGYHGGSADWFGITTWLNKGIPKILEEYIFKFDYNQIETLEKIFAEHPQEIAAVILEPVVLEEPKDNFLEKVKELAHKNGAILIFDEMVTGFRVSLGGAQEHFKVTPDLATFGKAVANGMPLSILAGKREIMAECENTFFSMTFGGEVLSLAAAKATIAEMKEKKVIDHLWKQGAKLKKGYNALAKKYGLEAYTQCVGLPVHTQFLFKNAKGEDWFELKSLFLQETIKKGILFTGGNNICYTLSNKDLAKTLSAVKETFALLSKAVVDNAVETLLEGPSLKQVFKRS